MGSRRASTPTAWWTSSWRWTGNPSPCSRRSGSRSQAQSTALLDLNSRILTLKTRADAVADPATFFSRSVTSSTATVATASAGPGGSQGSYTLTVTALARGSIAISDATRAAVTDTVASGAGTVQFKLGTTGSVVSIAVDATTTLDGLTRAINDKNSGVRASLVNTGTSALPAWKITLASNSTGASNDITILADDTTLDIASSQTAVDAAFSLSGLGNFTRATNTFSDVLDGVTITLKAGTGTTDLVVDLDKAATQNRVQALLDAYNDVVKAIDGQAAAAVGTDGKVKTGAFTGDAATRQIRRSLSATIAQRFDGAFQALAAIGVTTQKDGTLALDAAKFQQAVSADAPGVRQLVAGAGTGDGIADLLSKAAVAATRSTSGVIAVRQGAITAVDGECPEGHRPGAGPTRGDRARAPRPVRQSREPGVAAHGEGLGAAEPARRHGQQLVVPEVMSA